MIIAGLQIMSDRELRVKFAMSAIYRLPIYLCAAFAKLLYVLSRKEILLC